ncbi:hypothetical protein AAGW05_12885 [Arthrobacter sp. LAPM80]|uniref:hypothetical protein n=1 Tax=Arthrobacter sp. LAPM80 TaxID=3141788 RepID=UPI00398AE7F4
MLAAPKSTATFIATQLWTSVRGAVPFLSATAEIGHDAGLIAAAANLNLSPLATGNARRDRDLAKTHLLETYNLGIQDVLPTG